jgi:molybdate transport system ATP-binding protein
MTSFSLQKKLHSVSGVLMLDISCEIENNSFISLYGPSGAGKTSLLRMLAGFMKPDSGFIKVNDEIWFDSENKINVPPEKRVTGFVFQDYALFPNMNVQQNISFALLKTQSGKTVDDLMELMGLTGLRNKRIQQLSGGQQQRVALARALVRKPKLLLLDEPLSAIDMEMRINLQETLLAIHSLYRITTIIVSHQADEIVKLTSKTIYLKQGTVLKYSSPVELFLDESLESGSFRATFLFAKKYEAKIEVTALVGDQIIKFIGTENNCKDLQKGDIIIVSFKDPTGFCSKL